MKKRAEQKSARTGTLNGLAGWQNVGKMKQKNRFGRTKGRCGWRERADDCGGNRSPTVCASVRRFDRALKNRNQADDEEKENENEEETDDSADT